MPPKTTCPISRADFLEKAKPLTIDLGGFPVTAEPREFSTGSFGWYVNAKAPLEVDGKKLSVQVGMNLIVVGSKEAPKIEPKGEPGGDSGA
jgi:hypothetical protein